MAGGYVYNTNDITIKSFTVNNTKPYTFQIKTPISFKRTNTASTSSGSERFDFNSMAIRIYEDGDLYISSVPGETPANLLKVYYHSCSVYFTTTTYSYNYEIFLSNITFSFTTNSTIRTNLASSIATHYYEIKAQPNWSISSLFLGTYPNANTGIVFNTTVSFRTSTGGSFQISTNTDPSYLYQPASLTDITSKDTIITNKITFSPLIINTSNFYLSVANIQSVMLLKTEASMPTITIFLPNEYDVSYSGSIIEFRKHPYSSTNHTTVFNTGTATNKANMIDSSGNNQTVITSITTTSSVMRLMYYTDAFSNVYWMFLYRS